MKLLIKNNLLPKQYGRMLNGIAKAMPKILESFSAFYKSQSQFEDNMSINYPTRLRSLKQVLSQINKSKMALDEAYFKLKKQDIEIKMKKRDILNTDDILKKEYLQVEIDELNFKKTASLNYVQGAVKKVSGFINDYNSICDSLSINVVTEEDMEKDEERFHIMQAFLQSLLQAKATGGIINEGNHIYFYKIGISSVLAQQEILLFLNNEREKVVKGGENIEHHDVQEWLDEMAKKYEGCAVKASERRSTKLFKEDCLHVSR